MGDEGDEPPRVRGGPPTRRGLLGEMPAEGGTEMEVGRAGVVPRVRPGWEKGSLSLLQRLPIFVCFWGCFLEMFEAG